MEAPLPLFIQDTSSVQVLLSWDLLAKQIDLDASCFIYDAYGVMLDVVYYNMLKSADNSTFHSGDEKTGIKEGWDEVITTALPLVNPDVSFLIYTITVHNAGATFSDVETASCMVIDGQQHPIVEYSIGSFTKCKGMIMVMIQRQSSGWYCYRLGLPVSCSLNGIIPELDQALKIVIDPAVLNERKNNVPKLVLEKGACYNLRASDIFLGLGWDAGCDLDAHAYLVEPSGTSEHVYFGHLTSSCGCVKHSGDNLTGEGDGDDEQINVQLNAIPPKYDYVFFVIQIFTANKTFQEVRNPFVRVVDKVMQKELAIFYPRDIAKDAAALVVGSIFRDKDSWSFKAVGNKIEKRNVNGQNLLKDVAQIINTKILKIKGARGLKSADPNGFSDPYAIISINSGKKTKTKTIKKTLDPTWSHSIEIPKSPKNLDIRIEVWDWDAIGSDDFLGFIQANIDTTQIGEQWITLQPRSKKDKGIKGEVCIEIND